MILDHSARQVFDTCKRKFYWGYELRLDQGRSLAMDEGHAVHQGLYALYKSGDIGQALEAVKIDRPEGILPEEEQTYKDREWAMKELLKGYVSKMVPQDHFEVIEGELSLAWEIAPGYWYVGIVDQLVQVKNVGIFSHEFKRTTMIMSDWVARFEIDAQNVGYVGLLLKNGYDAKGAILSVLRATKYPDYVREPFVFPKWLLEEWETETRQVVAEIEFRQQKTEEWGYQQAWPKNTHECFQYNKPCPYRKLCTEPPEMREVMLKEGFFKKKGAREEGILAKARELGHAALFESSR